jgi:hypothetical protein
LRGAEFAGLVAQPNVGHRKEDDMWKRRKTCLLVITALASFISGCESTPSPDLAQQVVERQLAGRGWDPYAKLTRFAKTNGVASNVLGVQAYELDYTADLTFNASCYGEYDGKFSRVDSGPPPRPQSQPFNVFARGPASEYKPGDKLSFTGQVRFVKKENGWEQSAW